MSEINDIKEIPEGTFSINLKLIQKYQRSEPSLMDKYKNGAYYKGYFGGVSNSDIKFITCKDNIVIPSKLQIYVLHWYPTYLLHPVLDRTKAMILQHLYWPDIRDAVRKELNNWDTCQRGFLLDIHIVYSVVTA